MATDRNAPVSRRPDDACAAGAGAKPGAGGSAGVESSGTKDMTAREDTALIANQLAALTRTVDAMADQLKALQERSVSQQRRVDSQQERTEIQQERIDLAARELVEVSERL